MAQTMNMMTPEIFGAYLQFMASQSGMSTMEFARAMSSGAQTQTSVRPNVEDMKTVDTTQKNKRKHSKPSDPAGSLPVGTQMVDEKGRLHEVVVRNAFKGTCNAWKLVTKTETPTGMFEAVHGRPLVDYESSDDEHEQEHEQPIPQIIVDDFGEVGPAPVETTEMKVETPKTKRKYTSTKPAVDPREHGEGGVLENAGKTWIVAEVKTRGDGKRLLWKLLKGDAQSGSDGEEDTQEMIAAQLLMNLGAPRDEVTPEPTPEPTKVPATPKKQRPGPATPAKNATLGETQFGQDGVTVFTCVERTRKGKDGAEDKTFQVWQKTKTA
jgi:hypothetical protein